MRDCTKLSVEDIRTILVDEYSYTTEEAAAIKGKQSLAYELYKNENNNIKNDKPDFSEVETESPNIEVNFEQVPNIGSSEWEGYVLSKLGTNEKEDVNGTIYPKCSGLRRLTQALIGEIVKSGPTHVFAPTESDGCGRATVVYEVSIDFNGEVRTFSEAADCWQGNTPSPFNLHPVATASTKAEGRVFKKILQLNALTAEEMSVAVVAKKTRSKIITDEEDGTVLATANQLNIINTWSKRLKINLEKFVKNQFSSKTIETINRDDAIALIELVQKYSSIGSDNIPIPEEILDDSI